MRSNFIAEKYTRDEKFKPSNPNLATGDFHSTRNYDKENVKKLGTPISESSSVLRDANSYDNLLNSRHKNKNDISEFSSPDISSYKNIDPKRGSYLDGFSENKQRMADSRVKDAIKYKGNYYKGDHEESNTMFSETSQLKSAHQGQNRSSMKKGADQLDMPEPQYKSEFATTAMFKTTLHDKKDKVRDSLNGYQVNNRDSQISNISNTNNSAANNYSIRESANLKESRVTSILAKDNFEKTIFSPKNRCLSPEYGLKKEESDSRILSEKAENEAISMNNKIWDKVESKQDKFAKLNEEISEKRRCLEEMKKLDKRKAVAFQEKQNLHIDGDPSIDKLTIEKSPKSVFTSNTPQSLLNSKQKPKDRLEESSTAEQGDKFKKTLRGLGIEGSLLTTSRHKMTESSQSQSSNTSNESNNGSNVGPSNGQQLQSNNKMASTRTKLTNNFVNPTMSQANLLSPSSRGNTSAHNQSVTSNCSENSRELIKSQERKEIYKGKSDTESFCQFQESPGGNKEYMKFMKKKKDQYEYISNINPSSTYQNREFSENKKKEENSEILKIGGGSDLEAVAKIRAMLRARNDENLPKKVEDLINELETHKKFYDCLSKTILECSSQGSFSEKPSLKQAWKWIKNLMTEYMQLKQKVKGGEKPPNEMLKRKAEDAQNESVQRVKKEEKRDFYNKVEELGDKRSPGRYYFDEIDRRAKESSGLKTMGLK